MPRTLLLADDSVTIQKVVGISFANEDVVLLSVDNGDDAVRRAREERPDLVLADVVMPGKNGYEVCREIKSDPELRHIPVVLLTGTFEAFDHECASEVGADAHITKPFESQALVDRVNELLSQSGGAAPGIETGAPVRPAMGAPEDLSDEDLPQDPSASRVAEEPPAAATAGGPELAAEPARGAGPAGSPEPIDETVAFVPESGSRTSGDAWAGDLEGAFADDRLRAGGGGDAGADLLGGDGDEMPEIELEAEDAGGAEGAFEAPDDEGFDLGLDEPAEASALEERDEAGDPLFGLGDEQLSREGVLDPEAARSYDVSSSDLESPLDTGGRFATEPSAASSGGQPFGRRAGDAAPDQSGPQLGAAEPAERFALDENAAEVEPFELDEPPRGFDPPELEAPEPMVAEELQAEAEPEPQAVEIGGPESPEGASAPRASRPEVTPALRQEIHDTLEKIAWEALGDLSDTVTRQVIERVEAIAWEVIPQMAEVLIREEIQRMKREDEER